MVTLAAAMTQLTVPSIMPLMNLFRRMLQKQHAKQE